MAGLQVRVALVLRVAVAVAGDRQRFAHALVRAERSAAARPLVDVVAELLHQVEVLRGHPRVRRVEPVGVALAGGERERHRVEPGAGLRGSLRTADRAHLRAGLEAVGVLRPGAEYFYLGVHAVAELGSGDLGPAGGDPAEALVLGDLPLHRHGAVGHAAATVLGTGGRREPGPQHDATRERVTGGDAQGEGHPDRLRRAPAEPPRPTPHPGSRRRRRCRGRRRCPAADGGG